jgi:hypothetical protein
MPNKENIRKWVEALRSGKYTKGVENLRNINDEYCCLGVACDVSRVAEWKRGEEDAQSVFSYLTPTKNATAYLPIEVQQWLGVDEDDVRLYSGGGKKEKATYLNDNRGFTFLEIADCIERTFLAD